MVLWGRRHRISANGGTYQKAWWHYPENHCRKSTVSYFMLFYITTSLIQTRWINYRPGNQLCSGTAVLVFCSDTLKLEWLPHARQTSALCLQLRPTSQEWLNHDWTRKTVRSLPTVETWKLQVGAWLDVPMPFAVPSAFLRRVQKICCSQ
jgi:hypothetical protein